MSEQRKVSLPGWLRRDLSVNVGPKKPDVCSVCGRRAHAELTTTRMHILVGWKEEQDFLAKKQTFNFLSAQVKSRICEECANRHKTELQRFVSILSVLILVLLVGMAYFAGLGWSSLVVAIPGLFLTGFIERLLIRKAGQKEKVVPEDMIEVRDMIERGWKVGDRPYGASTLCVCTPIEKIDVPKY